MNQELIGAARSHRAKSGSNPSSAISFQHATPSRLRRLRTQPRQGDYLLDFFLNDGGRGIACGDERQSEANLPAPSHLQKADRPPPATLSSYPKPLPLRGQLDELCAAISENNPTCFKLTWDFALERCPQAIVKGGIGRKNVAQLVQMTMNLPPCSRKAARAVAPDRVTGHRGPARSPSLPRRRFLSTRANFRERRRQRTLAAKPSGSSPREAPSPS